MKPSGGDWCCSKCGMKKPIQGSESVKSDARETLDRMVVDEATSGGTVPQTDAECPKCGHNKAYWRLRQMRAADEPETRIFRCVKCSHTWRDNA